MLHVGGRRPSHLDIDVVTFALGRVTGRSHRLGGQIHATDERRLARLAGIDQPALLMLTIGSVGAIPADAETRAARFEHFVIFRRAWKRAAIADALGIRPPEKDAYVET